MSIVGTGLKFGADIALVALSRGKLTGEVFGRIARDGLKDALKHDAPHLSSSGSNPIATG